MRSPRGPHPDPALYPFAPRTFETPEGPMHYVDEGDGPPLLLVHGTPTWSFLYRHLVQELSVSHRVIAPDHLGFGLSARPSRTLSGPDLDRRLGPRAQAHRLAGLIEHLELADFTMGVHDFGGPIGLSWALDHPDRLRGLVLFNTWMWSLEGTSAERIGRLMAGPVGRFLYLRLNASARWLVPTMFADRSRLPRIVHRHFTERFPDVVERQGPWALARALIGESEWYDALWARRERLRSLPALLLWGMKDPAFGEEALARWTGALPEARVVRVPEAGHFVQEEAPEEAVRAISAFLTALS